MHWSVSGLLFSTTLYFSPCTSKTLPYHHSFIIVQIYGRTNPPLLFICSSVSQFLFCILISLLSVCVYDFIRDCLAFPSVEFASSWDTPTKNINKNQEVLTWAILSPRFFIHWDFRDIFPQAASETNHPNDWPCCQNESLLVMLPNDLSFFDPLPESYSRNLA